MPSNALAYTCIHPDQASPRIELRTRSIGRRRSFVASADLPFRQESGDGMEYVEHPEIRFLMSFMKANLSEDGRKSNLRTRHSGSPNSGELRLKTRPPPSPPTSTSLPSHVLLLLLLRSPPNLSLRDPNARHLPPRLPHLPLSDPLSLLTFGSFARSRLF